jgi:hypothetical protein
VVTERLRDIADEVHEIRTTVTGNGHPESGLAFRTMALERELDTNRRVAEHRQRDFLSPMMAAALTIVASMILSRMESCERTHIGQALPPVEGRR